MRFLQNFGRFLCLEVSIFFRQPPGSVGVSISCFCKALVHVENFAPFTRVFRSTITTLRQSVESIVFNHLAHLYSLVTAVVQELLSKTWKRTLDFMLVYIRYDWLLLGDNQKKVNQFLQLKCLLSHKIQTCTAPEMIPTPKWSQPRNDPQIDPEMIPTPKWSRFLFTSTPKWSPYNFRNGMHNIIT